MKKGIRPWAVAKFLELAPTRVNSAEGNRAFRKTVRNAIIAQFQVTEDAASTHYNYSKKEAQRTNPELLVGLGRALDKLGGRKRKAKTLAEPLLLTYNKPMLLLTYAPPAVLCTVVKCSDGTVVAADVTQAEAETLIAKAAAQKKAKLRLL